MGKRSFAPDSDVCDFDKLIESIVDYDWPRMVRTLTHECERAEHLRQMEYAKRVGWVLHWFNYNALADGDKERAACHRIAKRLIERGQIKPDGLDAFGEEDFTGRPASRPEGYLESILGLQRDHEHDRMAGL